MLDTTYAHPKHTFPPQQEAIAMMMEVHPSSSGSCLCVERCVNFSISLALP
jgi:hypothetical protein